MTCSDLEASTIQTPILQLIFILLAIPIGIAWLWSLGAIRYFAPVPVAVRTPLFVVVATAPWVLAPFVGQEIVLLVTTIVVISVLVGWFVVKPRNDLDWAADQQRIPEVVWDGDNVTIHNLRRATYRSQTDFDVTWYSQTYNLSEVRSVEYVVEPFGKLPATAHTFVTFGFSDGYYLPISIEVRREKPEVFSPIAGIYRQYEIMYVMGDERDLIGLRANVRKDDVYLYPIRASRQQVRRLLESMLQKATSLNVEPEFYNTITNNCATSVLRHLNEIEGKRFPIDYRIVAPGWSDRYAYEHGLIDTDLSFEAAKPVYQINSRSKFGADEEVWSKQIRMLGAA